VELIDYILEPAIPFGVVVWTLWFIFRDEIRGAFSDEEN
jgi:hypothetical protein